MKPDNKTILITGATNGIGKAAAIALAEKGHHIIIHGRNEVLAREVQKEIISQTNNPNVDYLIADLFLMSELRKLVAGFMERYGQLDVLINNAGGIMGKQREETAEGIEKTIALNVLAPYLLSVLLLPALEKSPEGRIVNMGSAAHSHFAKADLTDIEMNNKYTSNLAYGNAKLYFMMVSQVMADKLLIQNITLNMLHPGAVASNALEPIKKKTFFGPMLFSILKLLMKTPEQGADTMVYLATSDEIRDTSGKYFINRKPARVNEKYISEETKRMVWSYCEKMTGERLILKIKTDS